MEKKKKKKKRDVLVAEKMATRRCHTSGIRTIFSVTDAAVDDVIVGGGGRVSLIPI